MRNEVFSLNTEAQYLSKNVHAIKHLYFYDAFVLIMAPGAMMHLNANK